MSISMNSLVQAQEKPEQKSSQKENSNAEAGRAKNEQPNQNQSGSKNKLQEKTAPTEAAAKDAPQINRKTEQMLLGFVRNNHPELIRLLRSLKRHHPDQYQLALQDIFRSRESILAYEERDPERYQMLLDAWKLKSRAQLVTARMVIEESPKLEKELREIIRAQYNLKIKILEGDRQRFEDRLKLTDQRLKQLQKEKQELIERDVTSASRKAELIRRQQLVAEQLRKEQEATKPKSGKQKAGDKETGNAKKSEKEPEPGNRSNEDKPEKGD